MKSLDPNCKITIYPFQLGHRSYFGFTHRNTGIYILSNTWLLVSHKIACIIVICISNWPTATRIGDVTLLHQLIEYWHVRVLFTLASIVGLYEAHHTLIHFPLVQITPMCLSFHKEIGDVCRNLLTCQSWFITEKTKLNANIQVKMWSRINSLYIQIWKNVYLEINEQYKSKLCILWI